MAKDTGLSMPKVSERVLATDEPVIGKTKALMQGVDGVLSLAQGVVYWAPPEAALRRAAEALREPLVSAYGPCGGMPALVAALKRKLADENGLSGVEVMVTAGANQAFTNVAVALLDASDKVILFSPYYFNHLMAIQMTGGAANVVLGRCHPDSLHPDLAWLEDQLQQPSPPRMVVLVNPNNPTGVLLSRQQVERASDLCAAAGAWLVLDNTYEHFVYDGREHFCMAAPHILNIFSFSKAYGMMGWRVGYIAYPSAPGGGGGDGFLGAQLLKVQDTIPVCPPQLSQVLALEAVHAGRRWVSEKVTGLEGNRRAVLDALSPLGDDCIFGGDGAIYLWAKLPAGCEDDEAVVSWLVRQHKVCILPGGSCGSPGYVRVAFANLRPDDCTEAAGRLKRGLQELVQHGAAALSAEESVGTQANGSAVQV